MALAPMMMLAQSKRVMAAARRNKQPLFNAGMGMLTFFLAGHGFKQQMQIQELRQLVVDTRADCGSLRDSMASEEWAAATADAVAAAPPAKRAGVLSEACTALIDDTLTSAGVLKSEQGGDGRESQAWRRLQGKDNVDPLQLALGRAEVEDLPPPPKDIGSAQVPDSAAAAPAEGKAGDTSGSGTIARRKLL